MNTRTTMLFGALALTLAAAGWLGMQEDETAPVSAAVERTERSAPAAWSSPRPAQQSNCLHSWISARAPACRNRVQGSPRP